VCFLHFAREAAGALRHPAFPAPSIREGFRLNLGRDRAARSPLAVRGCLTGELGAPSPVKEPAARRDPAFQRVVGGSIFLPLGCQVEISPYLPVMKQPVIARPRRASPILVCRKCLGRVSGAKKIRRELKSELKRQRNEAPNERSLKSPRLVMTGCFGICPKKAVVLASGKSLQNGEYVLVSDRERVGDALNLLQLSS
jgi:hypothetical protein